MANIQGRVNSIRERTRNILAINRSRSAHGERRPRPWAGGADAHRGCSKKTSRSIRGPGEVVAYGERSIDGEVSPAVRTKLTNLRIVGPAGLNEIEDVI